MPAGSAIELTLPIRLAVVDLNSGNNTDKMAAYSEDKLFTFKDREDSLSDEDDVVHM